jgi:hypothetical protein
MLGICISLMSMHQHNIVEPEMLSSLIGDMLAVLTSFCCCIKVGISYDSSSFQYEMLDGHSCPDLCCLCDNFRVRLRWTR